MKFIILVLYLAVQGEAPTTTEVRGFMTAKACNQAAETWLMDKVSRRDVYVASAYCEKGTNAERPAKSHS